MDHILIIEDSADVNHMLTESLRGAGYRVSSAYTGDDGYRELQTGGFDLVLLDIMLPFRNGDDLLQALRAFSDTPVMIISAKDGIDSKIDLLRLGADDYMTKPFDLGEVAARVESLLRRSRRDAVPTGLYRFKDLVLDDSLKQVSIRGMVLAVTAREYGILELLLKHPGKVYTKGNLYDSLWQDNGEGDENAVKTHMSNLRAKLKKANPAEEYIETVWGLGYRLQKEPVS